MVTKSYSRTFRKRIKAHVRNGVKVKSYLKNVKKVVKGYNRTVKTVKSVTDVKTYTRLITKRIASHIRNGKEVKSYLRKVKTIVKGYNRVGNLPKIGKKIGNVPKTITNKIKNAPLKVVKSLFKPLNTTELSTLAKYENIKEAWMNEFVLRAIDTEELEANGYYRNYKQKNYGEAKEYAEKYVKDAFKNKMREKSLGMSEEELEKWAVKLVETVAKALILI